MYKHVDNLYIYIANDDCWVVLSVDVLYICTNFRKHESLGEGGGIKITENDSRITPIPTKQVQGILAKEPWLVIINGQKR